MDNELKFITYSIRKMNLTLTPVTTQNTQFKIMPKINCAIRKTQNGTTECIMSLAIKNEDEKTVSPFEAEIEVVGKFTISGDEQYQRSCVPIIAQTLFPYLRTALSTLTATANVPPYILPVIDFTKPTNISNVGDNVNQTHILS